MKKNKIEQFAMDKVQYTLDNLLNEVMDSTDENDKESWKDDKAERECQPKRIVIQMLIELAAKYGADLYSDGERLSNALVVKVNGDGLLSGYMFHLSQNPQFDYSWSYMRKRQKSYIEFLVSTVRFLKDMISDINEFIRMFPEGEDLHVVFGDVFDVSLLNEEPYAKVRIIWEDFHRLSSLKKDYNISIKKQDSMLVAGNRKDTSSLGKLFEAALKMFGNTVSDSE